MTTSDQRAADIRVGDSRNDAKEGRMDIPVLTLRQPWAQLIVAGRKTIETRSWKHSYRGPLAIHAGMAKADFNDPVYAHCSSNGLLHDDIRPLTFGAIVAVAELVDIVPMEQGTGEMPIGGGVRLVITPEGRLVVCDPDIRAWYWRTVTSEKPYGDYQPGRYAWLLADVRALAEPVPFKGGQGLQKRISLDLLTVPA